MGTGRAGPWVDADFPGSGRVTALQAASTLQGDAAVALAGTANGRIYRSLDEGGSWKVSLSAPGSPVRQILSIDGHPPGGGGGIRDTGLFPPVLRRPHGRRWTSLTAGLADPGIHSLDVDGDELAAGLENGGVFRKKLDPVTAIRAGEGREQALQVSHARRQVRGRLHVRKKPIMSQNLQAGDKPSWLSFGNPA